MFVDVFGLEGLIKDVFCMIWKGVVVFVYLGKYYKYFLKYF